MTGEIPYYTDSHKSFMEKLGEKGYTDKVEVLIQKPYPDPISLGNAARKLIAYDVNVIVAYGSPAAEAVLKEKSGIPLVYSCVYEPCYLSWAKNVTGICSKALVSSLLRYLRSLKAIKNLGVIYNADEKDSLHQTQELSMIANRYDLKIVEINLIKADDINKKLPGSNVDAFFIVQSSIASMKFSSIINFSVEQKIPTASLIFDRNNYATITLTPVSKEQGEKAAEKVVSILEGVSPDKINTDFASETDLIFNLKAANSSGFRIPMDLITEATKLIQ